MTLATLTVATTFALCSIPCALPGFKPSFVSGRLGDFYLMTHNLILKSYRESVTVKISRESFFLNLNLSM